MRTKTFQKNGLTITVREELGTDFLDRQVVNTNLGYLMANDFERNRYFAFGQVLTQTVSIEGELGFAWQGMSTPLAMLRSIYEQWAALSGDLLLGWMSAIYDVNAPPNASDLLPREMVDPNDSATPASTSDAVHNADGSTPISPRKPKPTSMPASATN